MFILRGTRGRVCPVQFCWSRSERRQMSLLARQMSHFTKAQLYPLISAGPDTAKNLAIASPRGTVHGPAGGPECTGAAASAAGTPRGTSPAARRVPLPRLAAPRANGTWGSSLRAGHSALPPPASAGKPGAGTGTSSNPACRCGFAPAACPSPAMAGTAQARARFSKMAHGPTRTLLDCSIEQRRRPRVHARGRPAEHVDAWIKALRR